VWAATATFVAAGVDVPVRDIAARAGVGVATIYRHFPTRADLIAAVYRHQVEACALAGPTLLNDSSSPLAALTDWIDLFIDFLITKRGLASALQSDSAAFETLHAYFLDRLVPVCAELLDAAAAAAEIVPDVDAYGLMRHRQPLHRSRHRPRLRPTPPGATRHRRPTPQVDLRGAGESRLRGEDPVGGVDTGDHGGFLSGGSQVVAGNLDRVIGGMVVQESLDDRRPGPKIQAP
jgi:AcrR family transcriptional regulator